MTLLDRLLGKEIETNEEKRRQYFERNRNKFLLASTTMPTKEQVKQAEPEKYATTGE